MNRWLKSGAVLIVLLAAGCATNEQSGGVIGGGIGLAACELLYRNQPAKKKNVCRVAATAVGAFAGSRIGALLDGKDRRLAEEASQRALAEREATVQRELPARLADIQRQQKAELAAARSAAQRAQAEQRALLAQQAARKRAQMQAQADASQNGGATWRSPSGNSGASQVLGPVAVSGRGDCQQVREVAYIQGKEVRQQATYCPRSDGGGLERVAA